MTALEFAECQLPALACVLGVQLLPFTLGHAIALDLLDSPFQVGCARRPGLGDALAAVELFSHPPVRLPDAARLRQLARTHRRISTAALDEVCATLKAHVQDGYQKPALWVDAALDQPARDTGVPLLLTIKLGLMTRLHFNEEQALATPLRLAIWQLIGLNAIAGTVELITEADRMSMAQTAGPSGQPAAARGGEVLAAKVTPRPEPAGSTAGRTRTGVQRTPLPPRPSHPQSSARS